MTGSVAYYCLVAAGEPIDDTFARARTGKPSHIDDGMTTGSWILEIAPAKPRFAFIGGLIRFLRAAICG
jgi:hypothetical protein